MRCSDDEGAGSVLVLVAIGIIASIAGAVLIIGGGLDARQRAQNGADLAAVAAASHAIEGSEQACAHAHSVALANHVVMRTCRVVDGVAQVEVECGSAVSRYVGAFVGRARAGPADTVLS